MEKKNPWVSQSGSQDKKQMTVEVPILSIECNIPLEQAKKQIIENSRMLPDFNPRYDVPSEEPITGELIQEAEANMNIKVHQFNSDGSVRTIDTGKTVESIRQELEVKTPSLEQIIEAVTTTPEPVKKFFEYVQMFPDQDLIFKYMTVMTNDGREKRPTLKQVAEWTKDNELQYLTGVNTRIKTDFRLGE